MLLLERCIATYGMTKTFPKVSRGTDILQTQYTYTKIFIYINTLKAKVDAFPTHQSSTRPGTLWDEANLIPTTFTPTEEYITADSESNSVNSESVTNGHGRNYMKLIEDYLRLLK
jgi:hypothetical protein